MQSIQICKTVFKIGVLWFLGGVGYIQVTEFMSI